MFEDQKITEIDPEFQVVNVVELPMNADEIRLKKGNSTLNRTLVDPEFQVVDVVELPMNLDDIRLKKGNSTLNRTLVDPEFQVVNVVELPMNVDDNPLTKASSTRSRGLKDKTASGYDIEINGDYESRFDKVSSNYNQYIKEHPEIKTILADFVQLVLHRKPENIYEFTTEYFSGK